MDTIPTIPDVEEEAGKNLTAGDLVALGYYQISAKYCILARLPLGKTGIQALIDAEKSHGQRVFDTEQWAKRMGEGNAGDQYLRVYARMDGNTVRVPSVVFKKFRELGGRTYSEKHWHDGVISTSPGCPIDGLVLRFVEENIYECSGGHIIAVSTRS